MLVLVFCGMFMAILWPFTGNETLPNHSNLVVDVLSFNFVGHMGKSIKNWLQ